MVRPYETLKLGSEDWNDAVELARVAGWQDVAEDWVTLGACATVLGLRDEGGRLVATAALCDFGEVASVAKMLVHPDVRGRDLAKRLLGEVVALKKNPSAVVSLIATDLGRPLYVKAGFADVERLEVCLGVARSPGLLAVANPLSADDLAEAIRFDARVMGCQRSALLEARWRQSDATAVVRKDGALVGFGMRVQQKDGYVIGPVLAASDADAMEVLRALLPAGRKVRIDVPAGRAAFLKEAETLGLTRAASREEMTLGGVALPGERSLRYLPVALAYG